MTKRKGSVLIQTVVICLVLSYIAVSITRWAMGRYTQSAGRYSGSAASMEGNAEIGTFFSVVDPESEMPCADSSFDGSPNSFKVSIKCSKKVNSNQYTVSLEAGGEEKKNPFVN